MLWIKAFHIVFVASWFAGLFYLPRIFVNLAQETDPAATERLLLHGAQAVPLHPMLAVPALLLGVWLWLGFGIKGGWLHAKLALVMLVIGYHHACGSLLKKFEHGANTRSHKLVPLVQRGAGAAADGHRDPGGRQAVLIGMPPCRKDRHYYFAPQSPYTYLGHARLVDIARASTARTSTSSRSTWAACSAPRAACRWPSARRSARPTAWRSCSAGPTSSALPMKIQPKFFPVAGRPAALLIIAARTQPGGEAALALAGAIMRALWADDKNIADDAALAQIANACGFDGATLMKASQTAGVQAEYESNTDEALAAGVFGSPWYMVDGDGFWGQDRLDFVERALQT